MFNNTQNFDDISYTGDMRLPGIVCKITLLIAVFSSISLSQQVEIITREGAKIRAEIIGYESQYYVVRSGDEIFTILESKIANIILIQPAEMRPIKPEEMDLATLEFLLDTDIEKMYPALAERIEYIENIEKKEVPPQMLLLYRKAMKKFIKEVVIKKKTFDHFIFMMMQLKRRFEQDAESLLKEIAKDLAQTLIKGTEDIFFVNLGIYIMENSAIIEKQTWANLLAKSAGLLSKKEDKLSLEKAKEIYDKIFQFVEDKATARKDIIAICIKLARRYFEEGSLEEAENKAREALSYDIKDEGANKLLNQIEETIAFNELKTKLLALSDKDKLPVLKEFIDKVKNPDYKEYARRELSRLTGIIATQIEAAETNFEELKKYFPLEVGRYYLYKRKGEIIQEKVKITKIEHEQEAIKVHMLKKEIYKAYERDIPLLFEITTDGLFYALLFTKEPVLLFPLEEGRTWSWKEKGIAYERKIVSKNAFCETPYGRFQNCLLVEFKSQQKDPMEDKVHTVVSRNFYAPGVGLVLIDYPDPAYERYALQLYNTGFEEIQ